MRFKGSQGVPKGLRRSQGILGGSTDFQQHFRGSQRGLRGVSGVSEGTRGSIKTQGGSRGLRSVSGGVEIVPGVHRSY